MHEHIQTVIQQMFLNFAHYESVQQRVDTLQLEKKTQLPSQQVIFDLKGSH